LNLQSPLKFDKSTFFTYELISKDETQKYIQHFDKFATKKIDEERTKFSFTAFGRDRFSIVHQWEVNDIEGSWEAIKEESGYFDDTKISRGYVNDFNLFLIHIPYLPYDVIVLNSELDPQKISQVTSYNDLLNIFSSINQFMEKFQGIIYRSGSIGKFRPCYVKFEIIEDGKEIQNQIKSLTNLKNNKKLDNKKQIREYYNISKKFRILHFDKEWQKSDMQSLILKQNSFSIIGFLDRMPNRMTYSNFEVIFRKKERQANWAQNTFFKGIDHDFSTYFHFVSIHLFLHYTINQLDKLEVEFDNLVSEYREIRNKDFKEQESLYQQISDLSENLFFIKSDLNLIDFEQKNLLSTTMNNLPNYNLISEEQYSSENSFSIGMLQATFENGKNSLKNIFEKLSGIQKKTDDLKDKFEKKIMLENSQVNVDLSKKSVDLSEKSITLSEKSVENQESMKNQAKLTNRFTIVVVIMTAALLIFTGAVFYYTSVQFSIENFESEFVTNYPEISLVDKYAFRQFEYLEPFKLNTITSHSYRVTVSVVEDSFEIHSNGECVLGNVPEITMIEPSVFFLDSGANEKSAEPKFRLSFDKFPYSNHIGNEGSVDHIVGHMKIQMVAENLQISEPDKIETVRTRVTVPLLSNYTNIHCEK